MALADYNDLKDAVQSWYADRTDLANQVDTFIALVEGDLNSIPDFRLLDNETPFSLTMDTDGFAALPADYLEWRQVVWNGTTRVNLVYITPDQADDLYPDRPSGTPVHFTIRQALPSMGLPVTKLQVFPSSDTAVGFRYYAKVPSLSASATTNWLMSKKPNIYLFGCLYYAALHLQDEGMMTINGTIFRKSVEELIANGKSARYARTAVRHRGPTP